MSTFERTQNAYAEFARNSSSFDESTDAADVVKIACEQVCQPRGLWREKLIALRRLIDVYLDETIDVAVKKGQMSEDAASRERAHESQ